MIDFLPSKERILKIINENLIYVDPEIVKEDLYKLWSPKKLAKEIYKRIAE